MMSYCFTSVVTIKAPQTCLKLTKIIVYLFLKRPTGTTKENTKKARVNVTHVFTFIVDVVCVHTPVEHLD